MNDLLAPIGSTRQINVRSLQHHGRTVQAALPVMIRQATAIYCQKKLNFMPSKMRSQSDLNPSTKHASTKQNFDLE